MFIHFPTCLPTTQDAVTKTNNKCASYRSLVGLEQEEQVGHVMPPIETMLYDNDQGFFGGLCL